MAQRVFFSRELGDYVVDAMCDCGHLRREHGSKLLRISKEQMVRMPHDGNCRHDDDCACERFTWARWVSATEFEAMFQPTQEELDAIMS